MIKEYYTSTHRVSLFKNTLSIRASWIQHFRQIERRCAQNKVKANSAQSLDPPAPFAVTFVEDKNVPYECKLTTAQALPIMIMCERGERER